MGQPRQRRARGEAVLRGRGPVALIRAGSARARAAPPGKAAKFRQDGRLDGVRGLCYLATGSDPATAGHHSMFRAAFILDLTTLRGGLSQVAGGTGSSGLDLSEFTCPW